MKMKYVLWIFFIGTFGWMGCNDDNETLAPSDVAEYELVIPQGNHDYDARIVDWFERTGIYILYKFEPVDVYFRLGAAWQEGYADTSRTVNYYEMMETDYVEDDVVYLAGTEYKLGVTETSATSWQEVLLNGKTLSVINYSVKFGGVFLVQEADEAYVGQQLNLLEEVFLNFYSDKLLRAAMPLKVLLGRDLKLVTGNKTGLKDESYYTYFNNLLFSYGDENVETMTIAAKRTIKSNLNGWFVNDCLDGENISLDEFYAVSDYQRPMTQTIPASECYGLGFVRQLAMTTQIEMIQDSDKQYYLDMILSNSYEKLTATPANDKYNANDFTGILHPMKDKNGLIRKKYDILIDIYKNHGIDLQVIGNRFND